MENEIGKKKIDAIYDLREAVEHRAHVEAQVATHPTPANRDVLLEASLIVEAKTQEAIEACLETADPAADHAQSAHAHVQSRHGNVTHVDFHQADALQEEGEG